MNEPTKSGPSVLTLVEKIIAKSSREHPADAVLRETLRSTKGLTRHSARAVSRAVFTFFRWRGWLEANEPLEKQLAASRTLAEQFARNPNSISEKELARAVPDWTREIMEVTPDWLRTLQMEPRLWLRAKRGQGRTLAEKLGECWISPEPALADAVEYQGTEDLFRAPEFHAGEFEVQDIASQAVGLLSAPKPGETWWDACAGEGGKTLHLSDLMQNKGLIWASDRVEWRLKKLKQRTARAKCFNYRAVPWDGSAKLPTKTKFDGVLVDAPCSGLGTWARNPHARWTTTLQDVRELAGVQRHLLANAAVALKPGGRLVYAVCTLTRAETVEVAREFEQAQPDFQAITTRNPFTEKNEPKALHCFWPQQTGGNGMFVAVWQRT